MVAMSRFASELIDFAPRQSGCKITAGGEEWGADEGEKEGGWWAHPWVIGSLLVSFPY